jgi:tetratricopeptide (TPR) repeat protein
MSFVGKWFGFGKDERYDRGLRAYENQQYEDAIEHLSACLDGESDPATRHMARGHLAASYASLGKQAVDAKDFETAVARYEKAIEIEPQYADLRLALAIAYRGAGLITAEAEQLACALEINPEYPTAVLQQGILLYQHGRLQDGLDRLAEAVNLEKRLDTVHYRKGLDRHRLGDKVGALEHFKKISIEDPDDANAIAGCADHLVKQGKLKEAEEIYRKALAIAPRYADVRCRHGQVLLELNEIDKAIAEFREAVEINSRYAEAHALLGVGLRRVGESNAAEAAFHQAIEIDPRNVIALRELDRPWR